jgi:hypothetical protein
VKDMRPISMAILLAAEAAILAGQTLTPARNVVVCFTPTHDAQVAYATEMASRIFAGIGVQVEWREARPCPSAPDTIQVSFSLDTRDSLHPGALAYALPFEGTHIVVFYDRVKALLPPHVAYRLLAHVLVHEITHILQAVSRHSPDGIMKARWQYRDYLAMQDKVLAFTPIDRELISSGLAFREQLR